MANARGNSTSIFCQQLGIEVPFIGGAMYPCSNPELVAAVSEAGGIGIVQPLSLVYVYGYDFREGLRYIRSLTKKPIGMNVLVEASSKIYLDRMMKWVKIASEEGVRFFITALGNPTDTLKIVKPAGGIVYHDVTERKWAEKVVSLGVDGLICVNNQAGGHAGTKSPTELMESLKDLGKPLICAGGIGDEQDFKRVLDLGYAGVQLGTRLIATQECKAHQDYKDAILKAKASDIVLTERLTGVPVAIIKTPFVEQTGTQAGGILKWMLKSQRFKHWARLWYSVKSLRQLKQTNLHGLSHKDFYQAGKSVEHIDRVEKVADIVRRFQSTL